MKPPGEWTDQEARNAEILFYGLLWWGILILVIIVLSALAWVGRI